MLTAALPDIPSYEGTICLNQKNERQVTSTVKLYSAQSCEGSQLHQKIWISHSQSDNTTDSSVFKSCLSITRTWSGEGSAEIGQVLVIVRHDLKTQVWLPVVSLKHDRRILESQRNLLFIWHAILKEAYYLYGMLFKGSSKSSCSDHKTTEMLSEWKN